MRNFKKLTLKSMQKECAKLTLKSIQKECAKLTLKSIHVIAPALSKHL